MVEKELPLARFWWAGVGVEDGAGAVQLASLCESEETMLA